MRKIIVNENQKLTCLLCGRDKFIKPSPHRCGGGFRKRKLVWGLKVKNGIWHIKRKRYEKA